MSAKRFHEFLTISTTYFIFVKNHFMASQEQITVDQHWAPRFYYKRFSDEKNELQIFNKRKWIIEKRKAYSQVSNADFFFGMRTGVKDEISQIIEKAFDTVEGQFARHYDKIIQNIFKQNQINDEFLHELSFFMAMLWVRSNLFRKITLDAAVEFQKDFLARAAQNLSFINSVFEDVESEKNIEITQSERKEFIDAMVNKKYTINPTNEAHLECLNDIELYAAHFYAKKWRFFTTSCSANFFTSDTPVVEIPSEDKSFWGNPIWKRKHYFSLTPKILIELSDPYDFGKKVKRKSLKTDAEVLDFNLKILGYSDEKIYTSDMGQFEYVRTRYRPFGSK